jgi:GxxExxY protein
MKTLNELTYELNGAAMEVHRKLEPGLLESVYEAAMCQELASRHIDFVRQAAIAVTYKGVPLDCGFRADIIADGRVVLELKAIDQLLPIHEAQHINYLKLAHKQVGLLINFNVPVLKDGIRRFVNHFSETSALSASSAVQSSYP